MEHQKFGDAVMRGETHRGIHYFFILLQRRTKAEELAAKKLATLLQIKNWQDVNLQYVLKNWSVLLLNNEKELRSNSGLKKILKKLFELKAGGSEEEYIYGLQRSAALKKMIERVLDNISD